jgi:hypothetical protein
LSEPRGLTLKNVECIEAVKKIGSRNRAAIVINRERVCPNVEGDGTGSAHRAIEHHLSLHHG